MSTEEFPRQKKIKTKHLARYFNDHFPPEHEYEDAHQRREAIDSGKMSQKCANDVFRMSTPIRIVP